MKELDGSFCCVSNFLMSALLMMLMNIPLFAANGLLTVSPLIGISGLLVAKDQVLNCGDVENRYYPSTINKVVGNIGVDGFSTKKFSNKILNEIQFGAGVMVFSSAKVKGIVYQELVFNNLAYNYKVQNTTILAQVKKDMMAKSKHPFHALVGLGANIARSSSYHESAIVPDIIANSNIFSSNTKVNPAVMIGVGTNLSENVFLDARLYYMGKSKLESNLPFCSEYQMTTRQQFSIGALLGYKLDV